MIFNFPDYFKTVRIFQMTANFPADFKTVCIFPDDCQFFWIVAKVSGFVQMQMVTPNAANFVWQTNFCLGGGGTQNSAKKVAQKTGIFDPETPFSYISALFDPFYDLFLYIFKLI